MESLYVQPGQDLGGYKVSSQIRWDRHACFKFYYVISLIKEYTNAVNQKKKKK